jgi:tetraacyldisaccharide 4'-kinase
MILIKILLFPLALLYALIMLVRNKAFDWKLLKTSEFPVKVISIGNLSYGGTGKTPLTEHLIRLLKEDLKVAVLSRGYGRKTRGFVMAEDHHTAIDIGDEPLQYLRKFPEAIVAVDERRKHGISKILKAEPQVDIVLLDDAYQHRYVKPDLSILLTDFHHLYTKDYPIPTGTLREFRSGASRADIILITKTPKVFSPILRREIYKEISPKPYQKVFYSYVDYLEPIPLKATGRDEKAADKYRYIVMFSGIANSYPMQDHLRKRCRELVVKDFRDHHKYTVKDIKAIINAYNNILSKDKVIFTTEKDAMRLEQEGFAELLNGFPVYYLPIRIQFHQCDELRFDKFINSHVRKNK